MSEIQPEPSSFRDPAGFVFRYEGKYYRQINRIYQPHYESAIEKKLFLSLIEKKWVIGFEESNSIIARPEEHFKTIVPQQIPFITYPYEWCFEMCKNAALLTLQIQLFCIEQGFTLKDATPYNIQFIGSRPVWIDHLSFEILDPARPWVAYRQFLEMQLYPLLAMRHQPVNGAGYLLADPEGITATRLSRLVPLKHKLNLSYLLYVKLFKSVNTTKATPARQINFTLQKHRQLIHHLTEYVKSLKAPRYQSFWQNYYQDHLVSDAYGAAKEKLIRSWIQPSATSAIGLDIGANTGTYSQMLTDKGYYVLSTDYDWACIEQGYRTHRSAGSETMLHFRYDIAWPSPAIGFSNRERQSITERLAQKVQLTLALAIIHHLVIGHYLSFEQLAQYLHAITQELIIEFVPLHDEKVQLLITNKHIDYSFYTAERFKERFSEYFEITAEQKIEGSDRSIFFMRKK